MLFFDIKIERRRQTVRTGVNLTEGSVLKKFIAFVVPIILSGLLQYMYSLADTFVVGRYAGDAALAAVGSTVSFMALILNTLIGLSVGANVVCAGYFGAGDKSGFSRALHSAILLGAILGAAVAAIGYVETNTLLDFLKIPNDVIDGARIYVKITFLGTPAVLIYNYGASSLRAMGDTKRPLYILAVTGFLNLVLNLVFVLVLKLGIAGVALGTVVSQYVSAVLVLAIFSTMEDEFKLHISKLKFSKNEVVQMLKIGLPAGMSTAAFSFSDVILQRAINTFGKLVIAADIAASSISGYINIVAASGEQAAVSFAGQCMGAKKYKRIDQTVRTGLLCISTVFIVCSAFIIWQGKNLMGIFSQDDIVIRTGMIFFWITVAPRVLIVPLKIFGGALQGMGDAVTPAISNLVCVCGCRVLWILFIWPLNPTFEMLYYSYAISWSLSDIVLTIAYIKKREKIKKTAN